MVARCALAAAGAACGGLGSAGGTLLAPLLSTLPAVDNMVKRRACSGAESVEVLNDDVRRVGLGVPSVAEDGVMGGMVEVAPSGLRWGVGGAM